MGMDRYLYIKLVEACICYYRMYDALVYLTGNGPEGDDVSRISEVEYVTRQLSVYADTYDDEDEIRFLKFKALIKASRYDIEDKTDILLGNIKDPLENVEIKEVSGNGSYDAYESFRKVLETEESQSAEL